MYRIPPSTKSKSKTKSTVKKIQSNMNINSKDTVYLMQNENQILKLKNTQLSLKVQQLKKQLYQRTDRISFYEKDCQILRQKINNTFFSQDIQLDMLKNQLIDKITLGQSNIHLFHNKINDVKNTIIQEQHKIPLLIKDKHLNQQNMRKLKMQNQGDKTILISLQQQNQQLRQRNNKLSFKKYTYQPQQKQISQQIEQRLRLIKSININQKIFTKQHIVNILALLYNRIQKRIKKQTILIIQMNGLKKAIMKKKIFSLATIRKKYVNFIKIKTITKFRQSFKPLEEQKKCLKLLTDIRKRRKKAQIWRIWRNQTAKAQYVLIRKFQFQTTLQKIGQNFLKSNLFYAFNRLKYYQSHHQPQIALQKIHTALSYTLKRYLNQFICNLKSSKQNYQINLQISQSASQHAQLLGIGKYFHQWSTITRINKTVNMNIKFKYFKQLKKLITLKNKNVLNQMLGLTKEKIKNVDLLANCFIVLKKQCVNNKVERLSAEQNKFKNKLAEMTQDTEDLHIFNDTSNKNLSILKISQYLTKKVQFAFSIWRNETKRVHYLNRILSILSLKLVQLINFSFSRLQKNRFAKLKLSIKDKISSCQYSYNYLLDENKHIKQVLQKKSHELQKAKFVSIIQRIIRKQKQIKQIYLYRFLKNGYKFWKVKKTLQRIDHFVQKRIKLVFMFLLKINKKEKVHEEKINYFTNKHDEQQLNQLIKKSFNVFKSQKERNKRLKRALAGVFDRNLQLNFYQAFAKMRNQGYQSQIKQINQQQQQIQRNIDDTNNNILSTSQSIDILAQRLKQKQQTFRQRKTMSIYRFFLKNIQKNIGSYIKRWKNKIEQQKRIIKFINILDMKSKSMIKIRLLIAFQKTKGQLQNKNLQQRLLKFKGQYQKSSLQFQAYISQSQIKSQQMKNQNIQNQKIAQQYQKRTSHMNQIKAIAFNKNLYKKLLNNTFIVWKNQKMNFIQKWNKVFDILNNHGLRQGFDIMCGQIKFQIVKDRIKGNLLQIYNKTYTHNVSVGFRIWRYLNIINKVKKHEQDLKQASEVTQNIEKYLSFVTNKYYQQVDYRINQHKLRKVTNSWRIYTQMKLKNNQIKSNLTSWLFKGYSVDFIKLLTKNRLKEKQLKKKITDFQQNIINQKARTFLKYLYSVRMKKHTIQRLFINKFCFYKLNQLNQSFFTRVKNYHREKSLKQMDRKCYCIQKVIQTFQKKRKDILTQNMRKWRRNQYLMAKQKTLMKRLTRHAMNNKVKNLFYSWKLEKQARQMLYENTQEGQIKKRKVQIKRLMKFLDQYKKQKGLLLQNQQGNFVVSPKFQQNKQKQTKRQKILKYKFISRLILSMNGYQAPIKAWNNLHLYKKLRQNYKKAALMVKNRLQKGDLYTSFKIWNNATKQLHQMFQNMQRKDLIKILNKQKDKMQIQYSKKVDVEQKVQNELRRYKLLSYQQQCKQRICAQILFKTARKVKSYAFQTWRKRVQQIRDHQAYDLQDRGGRRVMKMENQLQQLQTQQKELQEHNFMLRQAVNQALELAEMIKRISRERDELRRQLSQSDINCQYLQEENQQLNNKLILAQREALNLLSLSGNVVR